MRDQEGIQQESAIATRKYRRDRKLRNSKATEAIPLYIYVRTKAIRTPVHFSAGLGCEYLGKGVLVIEPVKLPIYITEPLLD